MTWAEFLRAHWSILAVADFFTVAVRVPRGLVTFHVFFVIELATRRVEIAGTTAAPDEAWMMQVGRDLTDPIDGLLANEWLPVLDRDTRYSKRFHRLLEGAGHEVVRLPARSPNLSAYVERFVRSIKEECLGRMIVFGEPSLRKARREFAVDYNEEQNHQGVGRRCITPQPGAATSRAPVRCSERLCGLLGFYHRAAAS